MGGDPKAGPEQAEEILCPTWDRLGILQEELETVAREKGIGSTLDEFIKLSYCDHNSVQ